MESMSQLRCVLVCQFTVSFPMSELCYKCFCYDEVFFMTLGLRSFGYIALHMETTYGIAYGNYVSFLFVIVKYFLFRHNYVIYLFDVVTFFNDVRNRFYFGTFGLRMEIRLQLRFVFVRHCDMLVITSQLRYLLVRCRYIF